MFNKNRYAVLPLLVFSLLTSLANAEDMPRAVVVSTNLATGMLTIRNNDTGKRHSYFLSETTQVLSKGEKLDIAEVQAGHVVALDFTRTDAGRELHVIRVPDLDVVAPYEELASGQDLFISGVVTGLRLKHRAVTIRGPKSTLRRTLIVSEGVAMSFNDKPIKLKSVKVGDEVEFRHHETPEGFIVLSGTVSRPGSNGVKAKP